MCPTMAALPKQTFLALAALSWADDTIRPLERTGLLRAARECGLSEEELPEIEAALATHTSLDGFSAEGLSTWQRIVTYALACWLARLDGVLSTDERTSLQVLAERLGLDKPISDRASAAAFDISVLPDGGKPERFDFVKLEARLREKLPTQGKAADAG